MPEPDARPVPTADLCDRYGDALQSCDLPLRQFGGRTAFHGVVTTLASHEDNAVLKQVLSEPGHGRVVVVDAGGSLHCAMLGDAMAARAVANGWEGIVVHGAIRDAAALADLDIGVKALGTNPRRSLKHGIGARDVPVGFGGAVFVPGDLLTSDQDGLVVVSPDLPDHDAGAAGTG